MRIIKISNSNDTLLRSNPFCIFQKVVLHEVSHMTDIHTCLISIQWFSNILSSKRKDSSISLRTEKRNTPSHLVMIEQPSSATPTQTESWSLFLRYTKLSHGYSHVCVIIIIILVSVPVFGPTIATTGCSGGPHYFTTC